MRRRKAQLQVWFLCVMTLVDDYGVPYIALLALFFTTAKGFSGGLLKGIALPFFQDHYNTSLMEYHELYTLALLLPWSMKPLFGILSDVFPIGGYRKRWYIVGGMTAVLVACAVLFDANKEQAILAFTTASFGVVCADLLFEASYSEALRDLGRTSGTKLLSIAWGGVAVGNALAAVGAGYAGDKGLFKLAFGLATVGPTVVLIAVAAGAIKEERIRFTWRRLKERFGHVFLAVTISVAAITLASAVDSNPFWQLLAVIVVPMIVFYCAFHVQTETVANCNLFLFLVEATSANFIGATDYFYTASCEGTPNFTYKFYVTYTLLLAAVFTLIGVWLFDKIDHWQLKSIFASVTVLRVVAATFELAQVARWNVGYISDELFYIFGEAVVQPVISMLYFMPMVVMTSRLSNRGAEGITYAILAGTQNMGALVGALIGANITKSYNVAQCAFSYFPNAIVLGHMVLPMVTIPLAYLLLPNFSPGKTK